MTKNNSSSIFIAFIIFIIILCTSSVTAAMFGTTQIEIFLCCIGLLFLFINKGSSYNQSHFIGYTVGLLFLTSIQFIIYSDNILHWLRFVLLLIVMTQMSTYTINRNINVVKVFYYVFLMMCIASSVFYVAVEILGVGLPHMTFTTEWLPTYEVYYYLYSSTVTEFGTDSFLGYTFKRNCGYFTEPGLYAVFIVLALFIYFFVKKEKKLWELALFSVILLSTFSTTGLIMAVIIAAYYFNRKGIKSAPLKILLALVSVFVVAFVIIDLLSAKQEEHAFSYASRTFDLIGGVEVFLQSPIWGHGYDNHKVFQAISLNEFGAERQDSNGVISALYQLGLLGCAIFYMPFVKLKKKLKANKGLFVFFAILLVVLTMGEPIQYTTTGAAIIGYLNAMLLTSKRVSFEF